MVPFATLLDVSIAVIQGFQPSQLSGPPRLPATTSFTTQSSKSPKAVFAIPRCIPQQTELHHKLQQLVLEPPELSEHAIF
jgi:hypothetical protein